MATVNTFRRVLDAIKSAPHAISITDIAGNVEMTNDQVEETIPQLVANGYIKLHTDGGGRYFTRRPKRDLINGFIAGANDLPGLAFDPELTQEQRIFSLLSNLRAADHAIKLDNSEALDTLLDYELVKEHRDKPGYFFTRKPFRDDIDAFLGHSIDLDRLFEIACDHSTIGAHTDHDDSPTAVSVTASMDAFLDQLEQIREQLNALLDANGR